MNSLKGLKESDFSFSGPLGSEGAVIEQVGYNHFKVRLGNVPGHKEWSNKLQFTLNNAKGNDLRLDVNFHTLDVFPFNEYFCSWSYDAKEWNPIEWQCADEDNVKNKLIFPEFDEDTVYVGHQVPMSYEDVKVMVETWKKNKLVSVATIGKSLGGKDIYRVTITNSEKGANEIEKKAHYFAQQHPGEHNAQWRMVGMIDWLLSDEAKLFRADNVCHFVLLMSPDSPSKGWYRTNSEGVDMNRTYLPSGSNSMEQTHEAWVCQHDLESIAKSSRLYTVWAMHTWPGLVDVMIVPSKEMEEQYGDWTILKDIMLRCDVDGLCKPLRLAKTVLDIGSSWGLGSFLQFGVSTFLCEGSGGILTKEKNIKSGKILIRSLSEYLS